jgi:plasmid stability protein
MARAEKRPASKPAASKATGRSKKTGSGKAGAAKSSKSFKGVSAKKSEQPASLLLRDMDPEVVKVLKARATRAGRSLQQELHLALRRDVRRNFDEAVAISTAWRERLKGRDLPDSAELLREDRGR